MASFLSLINGIGRMTNSAGQSIYNATISIVASGGTSPTSVNGPVTAGTALTLPQSFTYTTDVNGTANINVFLNGQFLQPTLDWAPSGTSPYTSIFFTFQLIATDIIEIRSERTS